MREAPQPGPAKETAGAVRLDVWLDVACLFKTRSEAQKACRGGKVEVNGQGAKPHRTIVVGDRLRITRGPGRKQHVVVQSLAAQHVPKAEARRLYEDVTPPPTPEELAVRELERHFWKARVPRLPRTAPDRRERRRLLREKEGAD
ncbi:MAG TPA: RNA-binding S4 domain-containing protein [Vicinamibacterales bacterium]|nr:RNA-binding S4 domain-containing protein [Vicinamibacterales bacterium]HOG27993.1 RNA-binding S4 domain-containing protein [Vicinamibacterales bacterium]HOQ60699.1 RNA-binding S4 domain-containing protein [Vicinamibacterales bacterium]HPK70845.1 RNA-binding S4 domain-containing protein [Vicinamibacterales bacterium]HPW21765.1 RNA-binding S4 domain-containing protein [Vicinamibacterales bacterium]